MSDSESERDRDSVFTDAPSDTDACRKRQRQLSVAEMTKNIERKKAKNVRSVKSPNTRDSASGSVTLEAIQQLIRDENNRVIAAIEAKFAQMEKRVEILESENLEKHVEIETLRKNVAEQKRINAELTERIDGIDMNRRLSSLILTCNEFKSKSSAAEVTESAVRVLNNRLPELNASVDDIQVAHKLQREDKVFVKFLRRSLRDEVYERRFELIERRSRDKGSSQASRESCPGSEKAPLFIAESLVPGKQRLFQLAIAARRPENGSRLASVFTRRGFVYCKKASGENNIRIRDEEHLRRLIGGELPALPQRSGDTGNRDRRDIVRRSSAGLPGSRDGSEADRRHLAAPEASASGAGREPASGIPGPLVSGGLQGTTESSCPTPARSDGGRVLADQ